MSNIEIQLGHSSIADVVLRRKYCCKKTKNITKEGKEKYKAFLEGERSVFIIQKLARDITECFKFPKAIELRKKSGCNYDDIMVREET